jgi:hypothetical protein
VEGIDEVRAREDVVDVALYRPVGTELTIEGDFRDRIGHVIACADGSEAACAAAEGARAAIRVVVSAPESAEDAALVGAGEGAA